MFVNIILIGVICVGFFLICKKAPINVYSSSNTVDTNVAHYTHQELIEATDGLKDELGKGSFGIVYKGILGSNAVAVKKLDRVFKDGEKEFKTEDNAIGRTHHKNLVQLLVYCDDSIAKGLSYLHEECSTQVIHCDIKPQNILLDDYYNAKISDFGLAKILMRNQSRTSIGIRGTKGYVAPEWFRNIPVIVKVDVYSFGVLLLEIISCQKSVHFESEALDDYKKLTTCVMVGLWFVQENPSLRPTMRKDIQMLEGDVDVIELHVLSLLLSPTLNIKEWAKVGPLSGKDPLVIVIADVDSLARILLGPEAWYVLTQETLDALCDTFHIPEEVHPILPCHNDTMHERPAGKIELCTRFFDYANFRLPLSTFLVDVFRYFRINISQLSVIRAVDEFACPSRFPWHTAKNVVKDRAPVVGDFNSQDYNTLVTHPSSFWKYSELFLCLVGLSRHYTLDVNTYPVFLYDNGEGG
ncbi:G-type lectin S-receptor-like serine/threonine-protein kinase LECRK3 [Tanacetum coccineum]